MKIKKLNDTTYQIVNGDQVLIQGTYGDCLDYMMDHMFNKIKTNPELLNVFKRMKDK
jgi:3-deoxy-D-arabino-heptulosonate 7-phosphate (DAHP) synthase class II